MGYIYNPKMKGSGLIDCIPQTGVCPNNCEDCFFQSGRSYLEPLAENLPNVPSIGEADGRVVAVNRGGNDSNIARRVVEELVSKDYFEDYFFNTAIPLKLETFPGPVVLTVNPGKMTDVDFYKLDPIPGNLMFVRIRTNLWNLEPVVFPAVDYYTRIGARVVLTFMAYSATKIRAGSFVKIRTNLWNLVYKKRTSNNYWCLKRRDIVEIIEAYESNPLVYTCGYKNTHECRLCGNCIREYYRVKENLRG